MQSAKGSCLGGGCGEKPGCRARVAFLLYSRIFSFGKTFRGVTWPMSEDMRAALLGCANWLCGNTVSHIYSRRPIGGSSPNARRQIQKYANVRLTVQQRTESPCTNHEALQWPVPSNLNQIQGSGTSQHRMSEGGRVCIHAPAPGSRSGPV